MAKKRVKLLSPVVVNALQDAKDCRWSSSRWPVLVLVSSLTSVGLFLVVACTRLDCPLWSFVVVPYHRVRLDANRESTTRPDWHPSLCLHLVVQMFFFPNIFIASFISYLVLFPLDHPTNRSTVLVKNRRPFSRGWYIFPT